MRFTAVDGRAALVRSSGYFVDVHAVTDGIFGPDPMVVLRDWSSFIAWVAGSEDHLKKMPGEHLEVLRLTSPVPRPSQVFGIGLNYRLHAEEAGLPLPEKPMVFTKFPSCITGPFDSVELPTLCTDWEVEVAVVIGRKARNVPRTLGWDYVAGITAAQDFSARDVQFTPVGTPQFSMGKSFPGFLPMGPELVTPDEFPNPDDLRLSCAVDGEIRQNSTTADLIFSVPVLVEYLSSIVTLQPGDVILTGTPSGVGVGRKPPLYLQPGQVVSTHVEGVGSMIHLMIEPKQAWNWSSNFDDD